MSTNKQLTLRDTDWTRSRDLFQVFRRWECNTIDVELTHALEGDGARSDVRDLGVMMMPYICSCRSKTCVVSDTVRSQVTRVDAAVKIRRRQKAYEPKAGFRTID